jgi:hypothetical protein
MKRRTWNGPVHRSSRHICATDRKARERRDRSILGQPHKQVTVDARAVRLQV